MAVLQQKKDREILELQEQVNEAFLRVAYETFCGLLLFKPFQFNHLFVRVSKESIKLPISYTQISTQ